MRLQPQTVQAQARRVLHSMQPSFRQNLRRGAVWKRGVQEHTSANPLEVGWPRPEPDDDDDDEDDDDDDDDDDDVDEDDDDDDDASGQSVRTFWWSRALGRNPCIPYCGHAHRGTMVGSI